MVAGALVMLIPVIGFDKNDNIIGERFFIISCVIGVLVFLSALLLTRLVTERAYGQMCEEKVSYFILSAHAKANSLPLDEDKGIRFDMSVKITYSDGTTKMKRLTSEALTPHIPMTVSAGLIIIILTSGTQACL